MRESTKYLYSAKHKVPLRVRQKHRRAENYMNFAWDVCVRENVT